MCCETARPGKSSFAAALRMSRVPHEGRQIRPWQSVLRQAELMCCVWRRRHWVQCAAAVPLASRVVARADRLLQRWIPTHLMRLRKRAKRLWQVQSHRPSKATSRKRTWHSVASWLWLRLFIANRHDPQFNIRLTQNPRGDFSNPDGVAATKPLQII